MRRTPRTIWTICLLGILIAAPLAAGDSNGSPELVHDQLTIDDTSGGDGDGLAEPGERFSLTERIRNAGAYSVNTITANMFNSGLLSVSGTSTYPDLGPGATGTNATLYSANLSPAAQCGTNFAVNLYITSAQGSLTIGVPVSVGTIGPATARNSSDVPLSIPSPGAVESTLNVPEAGLVGKVSVRIGELRHTYDEDLRISLIAPDATRVILAEYVGGDGDDFVNTTFDDAAATSIWGGNPPFTGSFRPHERLGLLGGRQQQGAWKLRIEDVYSADSGTLHAWGADTGVARCNRAPVAEITLRTDEPKAGQSVTFESTSSDPDGAIASQAWDLDNDGAFDDGQGVTAARVFPSADTYTVRLQATDNSGDSAVATEQFVVDAAPRAVRRAGCTVPNVRGMTLRGARRTLRRRGCRVGRVTRARSRARKGRVVAQRPRPRTRLRRGGRVNLVVSR